MNTVIRLVDAEDAEHVLAKYYQYVHNYQRCNRQTLGLVLVWACDTVRWLDDLDVYLKYLNAHIETLWAGIVREDDTLDGLIDGTSGRTAIIFLAELFLKHIEYIIDKVELRIKTICIRMIFKNGDFVDLIGRLVIWFSRVDVPDEHLGKRYL
ncbi:hypothetical protein FRC12_010656 [Ceratobasidium sp. 428]|nr:hypothetical protein FRC12_010656 [Ceratobasidium sp. 428]